jgi:ribosome-associated protein
LESKELARLITEYALEKKAEDVVLLNLIEVTTITDYFVICSADSEAQVKAITDNIIVKLKEQKIKIWHTEGYLSLKWVLLDLVDVVVHIFQPETRGYYSLERLWGDAEITKVKDL